MFLTVAGWTNASPVSKHVAAVSPELSGFIEKYGFGLGLGIKPQTGIFRFHADYNKKSETSALPPCLISYLEGFVQILPKENIDHGMAVFLRDYLSANMSERDIDKYLSGSGTANIRLNKNGLRFLSELLLNKDNCGKTAPGNFADGITKDIKISPAIAGMSVGVSDIRSLRYLETVLAAPETAFDGGGRKNEGEVWPDGNAEESERYQESGASGNPKYATVVGSMDKLRVKPPKPKEEKPLHVRNGFADVRWARQFWKDKDIPIVSGVMDFFAGMVQFAQDDGAIIGYEGITSPQGRKAARDFLVNSFWMAMSVPAVSRVVTGAIANVASGIFNGGRAVAGNYRLLARFHTVPGVAYTKAEPIWIGLEKIMKGSGAGKGIIHIGFAKFQAGIHLGLNFLGETHIYFSHVYIRALNLTIPNGAIRELWKYFNDKSDIENAPSFML